MSNSLLIPVYCQIINDTYSELKGQFSNKVLPNAPYQTFDLKEGASTDWFEFKRSPELPPEIKIVMLKVQISQPFSKDYSVEVRYEDEKKVYVSVHIYSDQEWAVFSADNPEMQGKTQISR